MERYCTPCIDTTFFNYIETSSKQQQFKQRFQDTNNDTITQDESLEDTGAPFENKRIVGKRNCTK